MDADAARSVIEELRTWLRGEGRFLPTSEAFDLALVERLREAGLPIARYTTGVPSLHPQVDSFSTLWDEDNGLTHRRFRTDAIASPDIENSPVFAVYAKGKTVRCDLTAPPSRDEASILPDLRAQGLTDYVVLPVPFADGSFKAMSAATRRPGGFTAAEVAVLEAVADDAATIMEAHYLRHQAHTLVETYIGPRAGERVLAGAIRRGTGETIHAAIWLSDLRGFTALSGRLAGDVMIDLLNDYFGAVGDAVDRHDGEILKFIGDAVLAIFPYEQDAEDAAGRALAAAVAAHASIAELNGVRRADGKAEIHFGVGLHVGDVMYGNVGAPARLDFTVIGPAVNLAARVEDLAGALGEPVLASEAFKTAHGGALWAERGRHKLKGIEGDQAVFAPSM